MWRDAVGNGWVVSATVTVNDAGVVFSAKITDVKDPRCLAHYGETQLKREKK